MSEPNEQLRPQCYDCKHRANIPGDAHSECTNPDPEMRGNPHGVKRGWWNYPYNFDPTWNATICKNKESK